MLRYADAAMYEAKRRGRGCVVEFDENMFNDQLEKLSLEEDLKLAIERNELSLEYQPIVDLSTGQTVSAEALLRWDNPNKGRIPPDVFIPVAEESKQIINIGSWVIMEACEQLASWQKQGAVPDGFSVSVNVSRSQLLSPGFTSSLVRQIDRYGLSRSAIKVEVTETTIVDNRSDIGKVLQDLRDHSIVVMMDDFGTGHSSLSGLHALPIDELKIDRSFIQNASSNSDMIAITGSIVTLADHLSMSTIGEGIETREHVVLLQSMGCTFGQGYFWSPPLPPDEFKELFASAGDKRQSA
jgi:EAL domain-containing protein (putative c-di-GMP-specific phosphodiesterase class I)